MSTMEMCIEKMSHLQEYQLKNVLAFLQGIQTEQESADEAFCEKLHREYLNDPDRGHPVSFEDACKELGVIL